MSVFTLPAETINNVSKLSYIDRCIAERKMPVKVKKHETSNNVTKCKKNTIDNYFATMQQSLTMGRK